MDSNWDAYQSKSATRPNPKRNSLNRSSLVSPFSCRRRSRQRNSNSLVVNSHDRPEATFAFFSCLFRFLIEKQLFGQDFCRWLSCFQLKWYSRQEIVRQEMVRQNVFYHWKCHVWKTGNEIEIVIFANRNQKRAVLLSVSQISCHILENQTETK